MIMFREKYKQDNNLISPDNEFLEKLAQNMRNEISPKETLTFREIKPFYKQKSFLTSLTACCIAVIIFASNFPNQKLTGGKNISSEMDGVITLETCLNPIADDLSTETLSEGTVTPANFNPLSKKTDAVLVLPVYRYIEVDQKKKASAIAKKLGAKITPKANEGEFTCVTADSKVYDLAVKKDGSFSFKATSSTENPAITKAEYEKNIASFIKSNSKNMDIENPHIEYITYKKGEVIYATGAYIMNNYNDTPAQSLLGYSEAIHVELSKTGEMLFLDNRNTKKEKVGEYKLMGVDNAIKLYNNRNASECSSSQNKSFGQNTTIRIEYIADKGGTVLQPVYIIEENNQSTSNFKPTVCAVPAINGKVLTPENIEKQPIEVKIPEVKVIEQHVKNLLHYPQNSIENMPPIKLDPALNNNIHASVLQVFSVANDEMALTKEVMGMFNLTEKEDAVTKKKKIVNQEGKAFDLKINKDGSYTLAGAKGADFYNKADYAKVVDEFISKYGEKLNIANSTIEYVKPKADEKNKPQIIAGEEYASGAYIFSNYNGLAQESALGFSEYIYIKLSKSGEIETLENHQVKKHQIGKYAIISKEQAIQKYVEGKGYFINGYAPNDPLKAYGNIQLTYITDKEQTIYQPVYIFEQLSTTMLDSKVGEVVGYAAVPAVNGELLTATNIKTQTSSLTNFAEVSQQEITNFFDVSVDLKDDSITSVNKNPVVADSDSLFAPVYKYKKVDLQSKATEILKELGLKASVTTRADSLVSKGDDYILTIQPNGEYDLKMTKREYGLMPKEQYEKFTNAFIEKYQSILGGTDFSIKYDIVTAKNGEASVGAVYLFENSKNDTVKNALYQREYTKICFTSNGELAILNNRKTDKDLVGAYNIISKSQAIKQMRQGKYFYSGDKKVQKIEPNSAVGDVFLAYVADVKTTILQPVYYIQILSPESSDSKKGEVIKYVVVPAFGARVITTAKLPKESTSNLNELLLQLEELSKLNPPNTPKTNEIQLQIDSLILEK